MKRIGFAAGAVAAFALLMPLAARTVEPYHHVALLFGATGAAIIGFALWQRPALLSIGVLASVAGYGLSLVGRPGTDPAVPLAAGLVAAGLVLARASRDALPARANDRARSNIVGAAHAALGAAALSGAVALLGGAHGPSGFPAEVGGLAALAALPAIFRLRGTGKTWPSRPG